MSFASWFVDLGARREERTGVQFSNNNKKNNEKKLTGKAKAPVFPEPVSARPITSLPAMACGIDLA